MKDKKSIVFTFLFSLLFYTNIFSTAQIPDRIIFNGDTCNLNSTPLESFFLEHTNLRPTEGASTACWRGYVGWYKIIKNRLVVFDITVHIFDLDSDKIHISQKSIYKDIFPADSIKILDWVTDTLILPGGKQLKYVHMGFASEYEYYTLMFIENGKVKDVKKLSHSEFQIFRKQRFLEYKGSKEYRSFIDSMIIKNEDTSNIDDFLIKYKY